MLPARRNSKLFCIPPNSDPAFCLSELASVVSSFYVFILTSFLVEGKFRSALSIVLIVVFPSPNNGFRPILPTDSHETL
jgi:hypothetical protein